MTRYLIRLVLTASAFYFVFPKIPGVQFHGTFLHALGVGPFTNQSLVPTKKKLEVLDKRNKQIDGVLRREYFIKKHRHS
ncbi:MAG: hypothetical protein K2X93_14535 [Candidatus Obscuribacterales bacterium]|nr:hypothetical protein [Candidatus Obscuribacterales bacterium]